MIGKRSRLLRVLLAVAAAVFGTRLVRRIPAPGHPGMSITEAIAACRDTGLQGWALVEYAQRQVWDAYRWHSYLHLTASAERSFEHGQGCATQINTALAMILGGLGFSARVVHAARVRGFGGPWWRNGHVWVRVEYQEVTRDVCAMRVDHEPGRVSFTPVSRVLPMRSVTYLATLTAVGAVVAAQLARCVALGAPTPQWMYHRNNIHHPG